jgi:hypothetical protein
MALNNAQLSIVLAGLYSAPLDLGTAKFDFSLPAGSAFDPGAIDKLFSDTRTLAPSASEDLDLVGTLTDSFGAVVTFARVKAMVIRANPANTNNVLIGGVTNGWAAFLSPAATGIITLRPGACVAMASASGDATAYATTAGTGDLLHVANSAAGTSVTYDVAIIGSSA